MRTRSKRLIFDAVVAVAAAVVLLLLPVYPTQVVQVSRPGSGRPEIKPLPGVATTLLEVLVEGTPHVAPSTETDPIYHFHRRMYLVAYPVAWLLALGIGHGAACLVFRHRPEELKPDSDP